jgi:putative copper resistance protein D
MDWSGIGWPLIATRAIHFAATAIVAGTLLFRVTVANPVLQSEGTAAESFRAQTLRVLGLGLAVTFISGTMWLLLQAVSMSGLPSREAISAGVLSTVLNETQFGQAMEIRAGLAIVLAGCLALDRTQWIAAAAALGLIASLAWTGHAGSTPGDVGNLHLIADVLHLAAAAVWIGGLASLILLFAAVRQAPAWALRASDATRRFSALAIISVAMLALSGLVNAWILVGSLRALLVTDYGHLLMLKLGFFAIMLAFAATNRFYLTPRLALPSGKRSQSETLDQLKRNSAIETVLGLVILTIVGVLGTIHPAIHLVN